MGKKALEIDMIAGSQLRDTQGEMLSVEGADISELIAGNGRLNDNHGKGFFNSIGRVTGAKKIFGLQDCENDRQKYYWEKVKSPYIYVKGILYDDDDHPNARAAAAILRNIHKSDVPLRMKASVEGGVLARGLADEALLARTKIHSVALTFTPANNATLVEPVALEKGDYDFAADMALIKSVMHLAKTDVPSFRHITRYAQAEKISHNLKQANIMAQQVGFKTSVPEFTPAELIQQAVEYKVSENITKIHKMIKDLNKSRNVNATHPSFSQNKNVQATVKQGQGSAYDISTGKRNVDPENAADLMAQHKIDPTPHNKNLAIHSIDVHETQHANDYNAAKQLKNQRGEKIDGDDFASHALHNAGLDAHEKHFIDRFMDAYTDGYYTVADPSETTAVITDALSNHNGRKASIDKLKEKLPGETYESMTQRLKDINTKLRNTYGQYEAGQKLNIPSHDEYISNFDDIPSNYQPAKTSIKKALTAGYGGASAPGNMTGGSVIQTESLDDGRKGFKYLRCNECGKDQVHMKHQVKCRECGHSFPMADLYTVMVHTK
jgi:hypothetical protein